jgi:hypothetical protein
MSWGLNPDGSDPGPPSMWPVGRLLVIDDIARYILMHNDDESLPPDLCATIGDEVEEHLNHGGM